MATHKVKITTHFTWTDEESNVYSDGSTTTPVELTISGSNPEIFDRTYTVANSTLKEVLNDDLISTFDFLWIQSTKDIEIQLLCNEGGTVAGNNLESAAVLKINANIPFYLTNDDSRNLGDCVNPMNEANYLTEIDLWEDTARNPADTFDRIEVYNSSGADARIRVFAIRGA